MLRQKVIIVFLSLILMLLVANYVSNLMINKSILTYKCKQPQQQSEDELYKELSIALLDPYIQEAMNDYYGGFTIYDPWHIKVIEITKPYEQRLYKVVLQVTPYTGPHIQLGEDLIAFTINVSGEVTVDAFEHLKTYPYLEQRRREIQDRLKDQSE